MQIDFALQHQIQYHPFTYNKDYIFKNYNNNFTLKYNGATTAAGNNMMRNL